jgi:hypothetical protein
MKIWFLLGLTFAAYNVDRVRSFRARQAELAGQPRRRAKRGLGAWRDCTWSHETPPEDETEAEGPG